jgi:hypothetical protein
LLFNIYSDQCPEKYSLEDMDTYDSSISRQDILSNRQEMSMNVSLCVFW